MTKLTSLALTAAFSLASGWTAVAGPPTNTNVISSFVGDKPGPERPGQLARETRPIAGWTVHLSRDLLATNAEATARALKLLTSQLEDLVRVVPPAAVAELRRVPLWISPEYPKTPPRAEYHPNAGWLREHRRDPAMAKGVEFTNVRIFDAETRRMPVFALHELAHAYHDRVLGFNEPRIQAAYSKAKASGSYDKVERHDARGRVTIERAYAMTDHKEYFAETSEAYFGTNDFFPFTRNKLKQHDPEMFRLLGEVWGESIRSHPHQGTQAAESAEGPDKQGGSPRAAPDAVQEAAVAATLVYKRVVDRELRLFIERPADWKAADKRPAIVFFFGGGWVGGSPVQFLKQSQYLASRGMVGIRADYRTIPKGDKGPPTMCCADAKSALRYVRAHAAELGIDPQRIAAAGGSAGGHLAAFTGLVKGLDDPQDDLAVSCKPNALVLFNPVFNNGPGQWGAARVGDRYKEFSPAHNITKDAPPTVVFLGSQDKLIPVQVLRDFEAAMNQVGVRCDAHVYPGAGHGFFNRDSAQGDWFTQTLIETDKFLVSVGWLKGNPTLKP